MICASKQMSDGTKATGLRTHPQLLPSEPPLSFALTDRVATSERRRQLVECIFRGDREFLLEVRYSCELVRQLGTVSKCIAWILWWLTVASISAHT